MTQESNWDNYRKNYRKAMTGGNYRGWEGGKGDIDRSSHTSAFQLGMDLIKIAEKHGKDSKEYKQALKAWRNAQND